MHTARCLKHSTYLCAAAVVTAAALDDRLVAVLFLPAAAVLCGLAIKAMWDDDAPPLRWGMLFDREIFIGQCAVFCAAFAWACWGAGGWLESFRAATGDPDTLPWTWMLAVVAGLAFIAAFSLGLEMLDWLIEYRFPKSREEFVARSRTWWAKFVARFRLEWHPPGER